MEEYFHNVQQRNAVLATLVQTGKRDEVDVVVRVDGGGITGQADAIKLGLARAMKKYSQEVEGVLRDSGLLTRDGRMKERKKYGLRGPPRHAVLQAIVISPIASHRCRRDRRFLGGPRPPQSLRMVQERQHVEA